MPRLLGSVLMRRRLHASGPRRPRERRTITTVLPDEARPSRSVDCSNRRNSFEARRDSDMIKRRHLGSSGIEVSALGMGSSPFRHGVAKDWTNLVEQAFDLGLTYYDTARSYVNGEEVIAEL